MFVVDFCDAKYPPTPVVITTAMHKIKLITIVLINGKSWELHFFWLEETLIFSVVSVCRVSLETGVIGGSGFP